MRNRELLLLRHAKSNWTTDAATDYERPLAKRGIKSIKKISRWLLSQNILPDLIISSPALRAKQTTHQVLAQLTPHQAEIIWKSCLYCTELATLIGVLESHSKCPQTVMLVGHNPELEMLTEHLADSAIAVPQNGKLMPTAALALFDMPELWKPLKPGIGKLNTIVYPRELPDI